ncbi:MAG: hypothetical protein ABIM74_10135 [candidate division WOR-3 bacterium]
MITLLSLALLSTRPLYTDDPWPVDAGVFELEGGQGLLNAREGYFQWKYGWGKFELDMGFPWTASEPRELGGFELSTKWGFLSHKGYIPDIGLIACWAPGDGSYDLWAILGKELGPVELLTNLVYEYGNPRLSFGSAGVYYPHEKLGLCADVFSSEETSLGGGIRFFPANNLLLDLGYHWTKGHGHDLSTGFTFDF